MADGVAGSRVWPVVMPGGVQKSALACPPACAPPSTARVRACNAAVPLCTRGQRGGMGGVAPVISSLQASVQEMHGIKVDGP